MEIGSSRWFEKVLYSVLFVLVLLSSATLTIRTLVLGTNDIEVPNLVGLTVPIAEDELKADSLGFSIEGTQHSDSYPAGVILYQTIAPGDRVRMGRSVGVYLSKGARERNAPRVVGLSLESARNVLKSADLIAVEAALTCSDSVPIDRVVAQDPFPGERVERERISLLISKGTCGDTWVGH